MSSLTSLEFIQEEVKEKITNMKSDSNQIKSEIEELREDVSDTDYVTNKLIELEDCYVEIISVLME